MAEALARGFIAADKVQAGDITASATSDPRKKVFRSFGANTADSNQQVLPHPDWNDQPASQMPGLACSCM